MPTTSTSGARARRRGRRAKRVAAEAPRRTRRPPGRSIAPHAQRGGRGSDPRGGRSSFSVPRRCSARARGFRAGGRARSAPGALVQPVHVLRDERDVADPAASSAASARCAAFGRRGRGLRAPRVVEAPHLERDRSRKASGVATSTGIAPFPQAARAPERGEARSPRRPRRPSGRRSAPPRGAGRRAARMARRRARGSPDRRRILPSANAIAYLAGAAVVACEWRARDVRRLRRSETAGGP